MKVIRFKVKTILLIIFMIFITVPYLMYFIGEIGYSSNIYIKGTHLSTYTVGALKMYDGWPTIKFNKGRTKYLLGMSNYNYNKAVIGSYTNGSVVGVNIRGNKEQALIAKSYFEEGLNLGENNNYYKRNINSLINLEMTLGNNERALELIKIAEESKEIEIWAVGIINKVIYYAKTGEYDKALEICDNNKDKLPILDKYINTIAYMKGDFKLLNENRSNLYTLNEYGQRVNKNRMYNNIIDVGTLIDISFVENTDIYNNVNNEIIIDESKYETLKFGKISGTVVSNGVRVPNAKVVLTMGEGISSSDSWEGTVHINSEDLYKQQFVYTNMDGEFMFNNVRTDTVHAIAIFLPSIYGDKVVMKESKDKLFKVEEDEILNVDIIFNPMVNVTSLEEDALKDELVVNYDSVEGATKYGLVIINGIAGVHTGPLTDGNIIKMPLTHGSMQSFTIHEGVENDEGLGIEASSKSLLGFINGETIYVGVIAYDDSGKIVSKSSSVENKMKLKKKKLNEGEKLILDGNEKEGFDWIYTKLSEDPMNKEYIYPIIRLSMEKGDYDLARELIERLEETNKTGFDKAYFEMIVDGKDISIRN